MTGILKRRARRLGAGLLCALALAAPAGLASAPRQTAGTLRVCDDATSPASLNPFQIFTEKTHTLLQQMLEGLVRFDPEGRILPALAVSWQRIDPLTMRFHLRRDVRFHDGEPFDAAAVKFSLEKYVDSGTRFPGFNFVQTIDRVDVVDAHTIDLVTHIPDGLLLNRLAAWMHIVPPRYYASVGDAGFALHPIGTGPFRFTRWLQGREIAMEAFPGYWNPGHPKVSELHFLFLPAEEQVQALLKGEVDLLTEMPGTYTSQIKANPGTDVLKKETLYAVVGGFNISRPPLNDKRVRQALNYALNRHLLIRYDLLGNGRPLASLAMPGETGYDPELKPYPYDPKKALALLRQAGVLPGTRLKAFIQAQSERTAHIIARQLKDVGIELLIEQIAPDSNVIDKIKSGDWDMTVAGLPNPMTHSLFIPALLLSSDSAFSIHHDPEFDKRLGETAQELDPDRQAAAAKALDRAIQEDALCLFAYQRIKTYGISRRIRFTPYITGMHHFDSTYISPEQDISKGR